MIFVRFVALTSVVLLALPVAARSSSSEKKDEPPHWTYSGEHGPEHWANLSKEYAACSNGRTQSPIDLRWSRPQSSRELEFDYRPTSYRVIDNGHTVQLNFDAGNRLVIDGKVFELVQLHFHSESEHRLSGKAFPLEVHLVHKDGKGKLAVIGVFFKEGGLNLPLGKVWAGVPAEKEREAIGEGRFNPAAFLPPSRTHYHYLGSLTTPPCTEGVDWNVFNTPLEASREQLERFRSLYVGNNRPLQPLHGRRPANH